MAKPKKTPLKDDGTQSFVSSSMSWEIYPWRIQKDGALVRVRVTPRGGRDSVDGCAQLADGSQVLRLRTSAAPQDGEATDAVRRTLAKVLGVPHSMVQLESGATSRVKVFHISYDDELFEKKLKDLCL